MNVKILSAIIAATFTMCGAHGKVPAGCCKKPDKLNVIVKTVAECDRMGGSPLRVGKLVLCQNVDY